MSKNKKNKKNAAKLALLSHTGKVNLRDTWLNKITRDNIQLLFKHLFALQGETIINGRLLDLPSPILSLPRSKSLPSGSHRTKWDKFAQSKGIKKRKRGRMVWDDTHEEYRPRH